MIRVFREVGDEKSSKLYREANSWSWIPGTGRITLYKYIPTKMGLITKTLEEFDDPFVVRITHEDQTS